jgi:Spy/CpxP family protein refolding chaperone
MNKTLAALALGLLTASASSAFAQPPGYGPGAGYGPCGGANCPWAQGGAPRGPMNAGDPAQAKVERMAARLNLTPEQKAQIEPIIRERQEMRTAQQNAMREQMARILTPEQIAQFDQMRAQRGGGRRGGGGGPCWGGAGFGPGAGYGYGPGMGYGPGASLPSE